MYAINFRSFHTAIHGLVFFDNKEAADENFKKMNFLEEQYQNGEMSHEDYSIFMNSLFQESTNVIEEINFRIIDPTMHDVLQEGDTVFVLNDSVAVDIY